MKFVHQIKVSNRIMLVAAFSLIMAAVPTFFLMQSEVVALKATQAELSGVQPSRQVATILQLTQQHRGLSMLALSGSSSAKNKRLGVQTKLLQVTDDMGKTMIGLELEKCQQQWKTIEAELRQLIEAESKEKLTSAESFKAHSAIILKLLKLDGLILDESTLSLDPVAESYHLIIGSSDLLYLTESLANSRAIGTAALRQKKLDEKGRAFLTLMQGQSQQSMERISADLEKAIAESLLVKRRLQESYQQTESLGKQTLDLLIQQILSAEKLSMDSESYFSAMTQAIDAQFKLSDETMQTVAQLLQERVDGQKNFMTTIAFFLVVLILMGIALVTLIARSIIEQLGAEPSVMVAWAGQIAKGDLTQKFDLTKAGSDSIVHAMHQMQDSLAKIVVQVHSGAEQVVSASSQIAAGNMDLSERTERQASALEETSSSMEELLATVRMNADNARQANVMAQQASEVVIRGGQQVSQVVDTMGAINESARKIVDIIGVIDGIAFQTNILALNAAVEAARAGEQGRGFAVVATEVRNLAQRSAIAAKEIKALIGDSIGKVQGGAEQVRQTGETMQEVVSSVKRVTDLMGEVSASSVEQSSGIEQVNQAIAQMDQMTQQNAALVEEAAAAAVALQDQSRALQSSVSMFKTIQSSKAQVFTEPANRDPARRLKKLGKQASNIGQSASSLAPMRSSNKSLDVQPLTSSPSDLLTEKNSLTLGQNRKISALAQDDWVEF